MTFLELCQRLRQEVGAAGNGPPSVAGQTGEYARLVSWVRTAWQEIQNERRWRFDWVQGRVEINSLDTQYALPNDFDLWEPETLRFDGDRIKVCTWSELDPAGQFTAAALAPDGTLHLNAAPDKDGALNFEYWRTPQMLAENTDSPRMPARFHMLIVYRAMIQYGLYENAQEATQQASMNERRLMNRLLGSQLPPIEMPWSLA